ncbi:MAG TPA: isoprenylcysteine carboxylmethyltransferase family protein [Longimicrobiales bacterium]
MKLTLNWVRIGGPWLLAPFYFLLARPSASSLLLGTMIALPGLLLRAWAAGTIRKNSVLTTGGPYAYLRNPLYAGNFLLAVALGVAAGRIQVLIALLILFVVVYGLTIRREERRLEGLFGDAYRDYARNVPAFFPRLRPYRNGTVPATQFSFHRYFRGREYRAALGTLFVCLLLAAKLLLR